jgi:hypothetical protein
MNHIVSTKSIVDRQVLCDQALDNHIEDLLCDIEHLIFVFYHLTIFF